MIKLPFLNRHQRSKKIFDVFYHQNLKIIRQPKKIENQKNNHCSDLLFVNTIPKTNEYENIPMVKDDEIKNVDCNVKCVTNNEKLLDTINNKACNENIINEQPINKINVEVDTAKEFNNSIVENMPLESIKEKQSSINIIDKVKKRKKEKIKNNIFKKFKT